jgi:hypothetical protein
MILPILACYLLIGLLVWFLVAYIPREPYSTDPLLFLLSVTLWPVVLFSLALGDGNDQ